MLTSCGYIIFVAFIIENVFLPKNTKKWKKIERIIPKSSNLFKYRKSRNLFTDKKSSIAGEQCDDESRQKKKNKIKLRPLLGIVSLWRWTEPLEFVFLVVFVLISKRNRLELNWRFGMLGLGGGWGEKAADQAHRTISTEIHYT